MPGVMATGRQTNPVMATKPRGKNLRILANSLFFLKLKLRGS
jgi:hypothetical protein